MVIPFGNQIVTIETNIMQYAIRAQNKMCCQKPFEKEIWRLN